MPLADGPPFLFPGRTGTSFNSYSNCSPGCPEPAFKLTLRAMREAGMGWGQKKRRSRESLRPADHGA